MGKFKVVIDPPMPSKEAINKHKDYGAFMNNYKKYYGTKGIRRLLYKDRRKMVMIVIFIILALLYLFGEL